MKVGIRSWMVPLLAMALAVPAGAQQDPLTVQSDGLHVSRSALEGFLEEMEAIAASSRASSGERQQARLSAARIRNRLEAGDFRAGDRVLLEVRREPQLSGEFTVEPGGHITIPEVGPIPLNGVLRSELEDHLRAELGRFVQDPGIRAQALIRVAIIGEVGSPGFFTIPASLVLEDVVMRAGGPTRNADLDEIRIERGGEPVWRGRELQQAILAASTLDQLNLQAGDRIVVPARTRPLVSWRNAWTVLTTGVTLIYMLRRIF